MTASPGPTGAISRAAVTRVAWVACHRAWPWRPRRGRRLDRPQVTVAKPLASRVAQWDEFTGRFEAMERVEVRPRVSGYIDKVHFRDGSIVKQGDLLFTIDQRPFQLAVEFAQADVVRTKAQVVLDEADYARAEQLVKTAATPVRELDQRKANLDIARAQEMAAEAALRTAQLNLEWTEVRAPIGGRVSDRRVDPGNLVAGGQNGATLLTTIVRAGSDLLRVRRVGGRLHPLQPAERRRAAGVVARHAESGEGAARRRERLAAQRRDEFRRQRNQRAFGHDPRPRDLRQQGPVPDAGHVRPAAALWRSDRRTADSGRRGRVRPGATRSC